MCGIIGYLSFAGGEQPDAEKILALNDLMRHGGPDSAGSFHEVPITLAMRPLSFMHPASADQPIFSPDGHSVIIFNGEIYNYKEIREALLAKGHQFHPT